MSILDDYERTKKNRERIGRFIDSHYTKHGLCTKYRNSEFYPYHCGVRMHPFLADELLHYKCTTCTMTCILPYPYAYYYDTKGVIQQRENFIMPPENCKRTISKSKLVLSFM